MRYPYMLLTKLKTATHKRSFICCSFVNLLQILNFYYKHWIGHQDVRIKDFMSFFEKYIGVYIKPIFDFLEVPTSIINDSSFQSTFLVLFGILIPYTIKIIFNILTNIFNRIKNRNRLMWGYWVGVAYNDDDEIIKIDQYYCREKGDFLHVTGKRLYPPTQKGWKWNFYGIFRNYEVYGYFYPKDKKVNSRGCIILRSEKVSDLFFGYYYTFIQRTHKDGTSTTNSVRRVRYEWRRGKVKKHFPNFPVLT